MKTQADFRGLALKQLFSHVKEILKKTCSKSGDQILHVENVNKTSQRIRNILSFLPKQRLQKTWHIFLRHFSAVEAVFFFVDNCFS